MEQKHGSRGNSSSSRNARHRSETVGTQICFLHLSATPPKCGSCHSAKIDPRVPERPTLKAAYHLQCMGCHDGMDVARPLDTSCASCHKPRATENAN